MCAVASDHTERVNRLFSSIVRVYDPLNRVFSFGMDALWRKTLARSVRPFPPQPSGVILDLAAGTLEVTVELAKRYPGSQIIALDYCRPMLEQGRPKLHKCAEASILPVVGDGRALPLPDSSVDAITLAFGLRNIIPRETTLREALRVLTPGGRLCVLEFGSARDRILFGVYNFYLAYILPFFGRLFSRADGAYEYLADTIEQFPSAKDLQDEMFAAGFAEVTYTPYTAGIVCLHVGVKEVSI